MLKVVARALLLVAKEFGVIFSALLYGCLLAQVKRVHAHVFGNGSGPSFNVSLGIFVLPVLSTTWSNCFEKNSTQLESFMCVAKAMLDELYVTF